KAFMSRLARPVILRHVLCLLSSDLLACCLRVDVDFVSRHPILIFDSPNLACLRTTAIPIQVDTGNALELLEDMIRCINFPRQLTSSLIGLLFARTVKLPQILVEPSTSAFENHPDCSV
ncbi:hypothetical protein BDZ89DRAFT_1063367, partial [Hymenopellis radicata]